MHTLPTSLATSDPQSVRVRCIYMTAALLVAIVYFLIQFAYWSPASPMIDQNAYEMGGKQYAQSLTIGVMPPNDFAFISAMYVRAPDGMYYPKYPLGLPMLYACAHWISALIDTGMSGIEASFLIAPISAAASVLGIYCLLSRVAGGFVSLLGAILLGFSPLALVLANQHWSHHPAMAVNIWGMFVLVLWWQKSGWWRGLIGGILLGFAVLIRYTEGLLLLPLMFVILTRLPYRSLKQVPWSRLTLWIGLAVAAVTLRYTLFSGYDSRIWLIGSGAGLAYLLILHFWRAPDETRLAGLSKAVVGAALLVTITAIESPSGSIAPIMAMTLTISAKIFCVALVVLLSSICFKPWGTLVKPLVPLIGWVVPVGYLVIYNRVAMGSWTGYDTTNESTGFSLEKLVENWDFVLRQLNVTATMFILPIAVLGLGMMYRVNWRFATFLMLWLVPGIVVYGAYYWGADAPIIPLVFYLRFFLSALPPIVVCAALLFSLLSESTLYNTPQPQAQTPSIKLAGIAIGMLAGFGWSALLYAVMDIRFDLALLAGILAAITVLAIVARGRGVVAPVVTGGLVALSAGMSVHDNIGSLERDFAINANLCEAGRIVVERVPDADMRKAPLLFTEQIGLINHLQVAGNFECYARDAFSKRGMLRQSSQREPRTTPDPTQGARSNYTAKVYQNKTDADLLKIQNDLMAQTLKDGRRIYIVLSRATFKPFVTRFVTPEKFKVQGAYTWEDPVQMSEAGRKALMGLGPVGLLLLGGSTPQHWTMAEVVLK